VDLTTTDTEGAKAFYGDLFGWEFRDDEIPGGVYTRRHGDVVAAIDQQDEHPPHWNSYVSVTSAEETAARAKQLGARSNRHRRIMRL
jgi:predicted enzyme related to lactoylglutathione lyase